MTNLGFHHLIEFHDCDAEAIHDLALLRRSLLDSLNEANATIIKDVFHEFSPHGITGVVVIAESHASIHTWPEHGYVAMDIFSCTRKLNAELVILRMKQALRSGRVEAREVLRGVLDQPKTSPGLDSVLEKAL